jgi:hypothetical protein
MPRSGNPGGDQRLALPWVASTATYCALPAVGGRLLKVRDAVPDPTTQAPIQELNWTEAVAVYHRNTAVYVSKQLEVDRAAVESRERSK